MTADIPVPVAAPLFAKPGQYAAYPRCAVLVIVITF